MRCTTSAYAVRCRAASMFCTIRDKLTAFSLMNPSARRFAWWDCCRKALTATARRSPACCIRSTGSPTIRQVYLSHGPAGQRRDPVLPGADVRSRSFHAADLHAEGWAKPVRSSATSCVAVGAVKLRSNHAAAAGWKNVFGFTEPDRCGQRRVHCQLHCLPVNNGRRRCHVKQPTRKTTASRRAKPHRISAPSILATQLRVGHSN